MYLQMNCIIVDADANNRQELVGVLQHYGMQVVAQLSSVDTLPPLLQRGDAPHLVIINLDPSPQESLKKAGYLPRQFGAVNFFMMSSVVDANLLMDAMHLGVKEFIPLPIAEEKFAAAIERVAQQHGMGKRAKVIHVIPTIGGCGSTTVACNVATSLSQTNRTALIDLDLVRGGAASQFDLRPRYTIADVMGTEKLDRHLLDNALSVHPGSKLAILARPELPEDTQRVTQPGMTRLLGLMARTFDFVVIDSLMSIDPIYTVAVQNADVNLIVMQLNVPSAKNAERFVGALRRMGIESSKIKIAVNRFEKKNRDIEPREIERALGLEIAWTIPNDFKSAIGAINFGEPVVLRAPKSEMSQSLNGLALELKGNHAKANAA